MRHVACSSPDSKSHISELNESFSLAPFSYSTDDWQFAITKGSNWRLIYSRECKLRPQCFTFPRVHSCPIEKEKTQ
jgi:hypothetical protein